MNSNGSLKLERFSIGVGDRFGLEAGAQLRACMLMAQEGVDVAPVWNKSNREHLIIGSEPSDVRDRANQAAADLGWRQAYYVDADHIRLETVDRFIPHANYFTIDVADSIGKASEAEALKKFTNRHRELAGKIKIPGVHEPFEVSTSDLEQIAGKYWAAIEEARQIYSRIARARSEGQFITEISMDETDLPQTPIELLIILAAVADAGIPIQTIAPKFSGRFNKGVDYSGDVAQFDKEFNDDLAVIQFAIHQYRLPENLKLSVHSGSDKFSIYPFIRKALRQTGAGVHLKTAGTTWLEEVIGLAEAGGSGLALAKEIYARAFEHMDELCVPYATVIEIDRRQLPAREEVKDWTAEQFAGALRHDLTNQSYNPHLRQLLHVGYKVAAQMGDRYLNAIRENKTTVSTNVTENLYARHLKPLFGKGDY